MDFREEEWEQRLGVLFRDALMLPEPRIDELHVALMDRLDAEEDARVWQVFGAVMTGLVGRWEQARQSAAFSPVYYRNAWTH